MIMDSTTTIRKMHRETTQTPTIEVEPNPPPRGTPVGRGGAPMPCPKLWLEPGRGGRPPLAEDPERPPYG